MSEASFPVNFPETLIEELAYNRCIIFIGAGVSATAKNDAGESMMDWRSFIMEAKSLISHTDDSIKEYVEKAIERKDFLHALQAIKDNSIEGNYVALLKRAFSGQRYKRSKAHELIYNLNMKLLISTNFDKIYENYCISNEEGSGHVVKDFNQIEDIIHNIKSYDNLIIKAHGTIDSPDNLIFTQDDYYKSLRDNPLFYKLLESLFLTHTVLFIGYSLSDPDINLLFNTAANTASAMSPHYVLLTTGTHPQLINHRKKNFNIAPIIYGENHEDLIPALEELFISVRDLRIERGLNHLVIE